jgi:hypothetical protein
MSSRNTSSHSEPFALIAYRANAYSFAESIDFWRDLRIEVRPFELLGHLEDAPQYLEAGPIDFQLRIRGAVLSVSISQQRGQVIERYEIEHLDAEAYADARDLLELKMMEGADFGLVGGLVAEPVTEADGPVFQVYSDPGAELAHGRPTCRRQRLGLRALADALVSSIPAFDTVFPRRQPIGAVA